MNNQEQSTNTPEFWAEFIFDWLQRILKCEIAADRESVIKENIQRWVIEIREDETNVIIRELQKQQNLALKGCEVEAILTILRRRLR